MGTKIALVKPPLSSFVPRYRAFRETIDPSVLGMAPLSLLLFAVKRVTAESDPIELGIVPNVMEERMLSVYFLEKLVRKDFHES
jgi:hypothetical protein